MPPKQARQKVVVVGAGPVGALAALYAAERGDNVEIYELRGDPRDETTVPLNFTKSINLALSERGINAMRQTQHCLIDAIMKETIPMHGRMIHGKDKSGNLTQASQVYDVHGRHINAVDRWQLNKRLLDALDDLPNVKFFFKHKMTGADFRNKHAWFEVHEKPPEKQTAALNRDRYPELEVDFDLLIGADGAHSAARFHLMKYARLSYEQTYIDTLWCEFHMKPRTSQTTKEPSFAISENHLHIWPGSTQMFIAIPSLDRSFTCTLFAPDSVFTSLKFAPDQAAAVTSYFQANFPGVTPDLISEADLVKQFQSSPALPLISIKCSPYHFKDSGVILGDAAHAMVPFYGQGMNTGLEDVSVLFECLDQAGVYPGNARPLVAPESLAAARRAALEQYTKVRTPDAAAINDLALGNYYEMRAGVVNPLYKARKKLEEFVSDWMPWTGWATQYARVSFTNQRYSEVEAAVQRQKKIEIAGAAGVAGVLTLAAVGAWLRWRR